MPEPEVSKLIGVPEAILILDGVPVAPRVVRVRLAQALGRRLAQDVAADRDYPPFARSLMDGYAVRAAEVRGGLLEFRFAGEIPAGAVAERPLGPGETAAIMTGAPMPPGADAVVPVEEAERAGPVVKVMRPGNYARYVAARASDCPAGRVVLQRGMVVGSAQVAVAATVGAAELDVFDPPRVAVLGTGDEIVPHDATPQGAQIRNSNNPMLVALLTRLGDGCRVTDLGSVRDDPDLIRAKLEEALAGFDALLVTGGMSMGTRDHVPRLLAELGVHIKISKLRIKPGKPFVFGVAGGGSDEATQRRSDEGKEGGAGTGSPPSVASSLRRSVASPCYVFGLPGNPLSAFVCTVRLASRVLQRLAGAEKPVERWVMGRTDSGLLPNGPREFYQPALRTAPAGRTSAQSSLPVVHPLPWKGSADLFTLAMANALIVRGENEPAVPEGTMIRLLEFG
jgi:molybdopterin molybdotransferase